MASLRATTWRLVMGLLCFSPLAGAQASETELHCTGKSWHVIGTTEEVPTDAFVRINEHGTYIAVSAVGAGQTDKQPRPVTNVESVGGIILQPAAAGQPAIDAWFNINRYSGELIVAPSAKGEKILFTGTCQRAEALF